MEKKQPPRKQITLNLMTHHSAIAITDEQKNPELYGSIIIPTERIVTMTIITNTPAIVVAVLGIGVVTLVV